MSRVRRHDLAELRTDLARFTFLLSHEAIFGHDVEQLFGSKRGG